VKDKGFLCVRSEAEGWLVVVADMGEKEALLASDPTKFHTMPHNDGYPTVLVDLATVDEAELTELICDAWRAKAPKRVLQAHEGNRPPSPRGRSRPLGPGISRAVARSHSGS